MKPDRNKIVPKIWILTVLFYSLRSIAEPVKYLFFFTFGILLISYSIFFIQNFRKYKVLKFATATIEFQILGLFLTIGIILSTQFEILSIKSLVNFFGITVLFMIYYDYKEHIQLIKFFRGWIVITLIIGTLGLLKWANFTFELNLGFFSKFYKYGSSLVSEYNFYACYFIISLVTYFYALHKKVVQERMFVNQIIIFIFLINVILTGSRRGLIVLAVFILVLIYLSIAKRKEKEQVFKKNIFCFIAVILSSLLIVITLIPFRSRIIQEETTRFKIAFAVYRYSTILNPDLSYGSFFYQLWPRTLDYENDNTNWDDYAAYNNITKERIENPYRDLKNEYWLQFEKIHNNPNLIYNGNFKYGQKFWGNSTPDSIIHELINTQFGKAIRVTRKEGEGYWPLTYQGRDIFYHKDLTYIFRFKFRVIKGAGVPFQVGWWLEEEGQIPYNLHKAIFPLNEEWFECIASYKFKKDHYGKLKTFMNGQQANTIIDFADIELICDDTLNRSMYCDQQIEEINEVEESRLNRQSETESRKLLDDRAARWKYALDLWHSEYNWPNKLFGGGFDYLEKFGQKFYPEEDRIDYPHNPIISSFLYSGILGGVFYMYFLALSFWYYWKYRKDHQLFFMLYLITFAFVFISSDSHFNVPIFAMLSLVPFITKYIVREKEQKNPI